MAEYVPRQGDFITVAFDPRSGHDQSWRRPALVVSHDLFNQHMRVTNIGYHTPFRLASPRQTPNDPIPIPFADLITAIPKGGDVTGLVMVEQVRSIDFRARRAKRIGKAPDEGLQETLSLLDACIF
jgi:mRNA interferase MazF